MEPEIKKPFFDIEAAYDPLREQEAIEFERKEIIDAHQNRFFSCGFEEKYFDCSFENFRRHSSSENQLYECVKNFSSDVSNGKSKVLVLLGMPGIGKTHLSIAALREVSSMAKKYYYEFELPVYFSVRYILSRNLCEKYREAKSFSAKENTSQLVERMSDYDLLVIDEISRTGQSDDEKNLLFDIIDKRNNRNKSTILISNNSKEEFEDYVGFAFMDRLKVNGFIPKIECMESHRGKLFKE